MSKWRAVWEGIILGRFHAVLESLRQNAAMTWMMLTMVEGISRAQGGIGAMLLNEQKHYDLPVVWGIQVVILICGIFQDMIIGFFRNHCPGAPKSAMGR